MGNSGWHAESEPHVTPIRNEADSTLTQVVVPFLWHWEAALMCVQLGREVEEMGRVCWPGPWQGAVRTQRVSPVL